MFFWFLGRRMINTNSTRSKHRDKNDYGKTNDKQSHQEENKFVKKAYCWDYEYMEISYAHW